MKKGNKIVDTELITDYTTLFDYNFLTKSV